MKELKIADSYAQALFELAEEKNIVEQIENDVLLLSDLFSSELFLANKTLQDFLDSPRISYKDKQSLIRNNIASHIKKETAAFMQVVIKNRRQDYFTDIFKRFVEILDKKNRKVRVSVFTAEKLPENTNKKIASLLKNRIEKELENIKEIVVESSVDESLIGGFIVKSGDLRIDYSVKSRLNRLELSLLKQKTELQNVIE